VRSAFSRALLSKEERIMNFDIATVGAAGSSKPVTASGPSNKSERATSTSKTEDDSVTVDTFPSSPPAEVHDAMGVAAAAYEKLQSQDRELSFQVDDRTGRVKIAVHDLRGEVLFTVPPSKALDIASGGSLD
jgi:flagellar protein FlaG